MNALFFILLIGPLVFFHELGHFLFAKLFKVRVLVFSLGFGPRIFSFVRGETIYQVCWVPLGGYVQMYGQDPTEQMTPDEIDGSFNSKPIWQRFLIMVAGPAANLLLPLFIFFAYYSMSSDYDTRISTVIGTVDQGKPAYAAGLRPGDKIIALDGVPARYFAEEVTRVVEKKANIPIQFTVLRKNEELSFTITPAAGTKSTRLGTEQVGVLGIAPSFLASQIGILDPESPAAKAGLLTNDLIIAINDQPITRWIEVESLLEQAMPQTPINITYIRGIKLPLSLFSTEIALPAKTVQVMSPDQPNAERFGLASVDTFISELHPKTPAAEAGFQRGDQILGYLPLDAKRDAMGCTTTPIKNSITIWSFLQRDLTTHPGELRVLAVHRPGISCTLALNITPIAQPIDTESGQPYPDEALQIGMLNSQAIDPKSDFVIVEDRMAFAARESWLRTGHTIKEITLIFARLIQGQVPMKSLGGPIMIYKVAGQAADIGWDQFLRVMALISINLGVLNLLPIPMLDGGHLIFLIVEAVRRKPPSLRFREISSFIGISMILLLMLFAFKNDIERFWPW
jgi:regulator of sigma E protease